MKIEIRIILLLSCLWTACEDTIDVNLDEGDPLLVVDAWINDLPQEQVILLSLTQSYFSEEDAPVVTDAIVTVTSDAGTRYDFTERNQGEYVWSPTPLVPTFGEVGTDYTLSVRMESGEEYQAFSSMNRVPTVDSVSFKFEEETIFLPDSYLAEFWARDLVGVGDTYWIQAYKNGEFLNLPSDITIAYDAGISQGDGDTDGRVFLQPIREGINPDIEDEDGDQLSPYAIGDSVYVEIHSITNDAFDYLLEVSTQTDRPGGFAELFSQPLANVPTNIVPVNGDNPAVGFFNTASVSGNGRRLE